MTSRKGQASEGGAGPRRRPNASWRGAGTSTTTSKSGTLEKSVGFLGSVRGRYRVAEDAILIAVTEAPPFVPDETLRRLLQDELGRELAAPAG